MTRLLGTSIEKTDWETDANIVVLRCEFFEASNKAIGRTVDYFICNTGVDIIKLADSVHVTLPVFPVGTIHAPQGANASAA